MPRNTEIQRQNISTDRTVKSLGYLDELEKKYDDPIAHFKEVARKMTYDVTSFYFEIDEADDLRKYGRCKRHSHIKRQSMQRKKLWLLCVTFQ